MNKLKKSLSEMWKDESAQGMVEYILILVAVVGFVMILRRRLKGSLEAGLSTVDGGIGGFQVEGE